MKYEEQLCKHFYENKVWMNELKLIQRLELPECYLAAGYVRNRIWDKLHGYDESSNLNDIDVVYYNRDNLNEDRDREIEEKLYSLTGNDIWSVKNQARMHIRNKEEPYNSISDSLRRWPETATAIGIKLNDKQEIEICSPHGLNDLFELLIRRSWYFKDRNYYYLRIQKKQWQEHWPLLKIVKE